MAAPRALVLAALALLLVAGPAAAQLPIPLPGTPSAGLEVKAEASSLAVSLDESARLSILVTHTGTPTGVEQLDSARDVALETDGVPPGWVVSIEPARFSLTPGQTGTAFLKVAIPADATESVAKLSVIGRMFPIGASAVPGVGPSVDPEHVAQADVTVTRQDAPQRVLLETVGPFVWLILLALVAAVVVIVTLVAANRRVAVRLATDDANGAVTPGSRLVFRFTVQNLTRRADGVVLRVSPLPDGWASFLPTPQYELEGNAKQEGSVVVIAPKEAQAGAHQTIVVTATSAQAPRRPATVTFTADVVASKRAGARADAKADAKAEAKAETKA